ncbi:hypothetical protein B7494_g2528 [Chlorociboria aeruginascens]|nr:hypothetical protein B7494_g2528 [Chlorociboria aeruginascens]
MHCLCTRRALSLFIRNVAQVDLVTSSAPTAIHLQNFSTHAVRLQHSRTTVQRSLASSIPSSIENSRSKSSVSHEKSAIVGKNHKAVQDGGQAFVELTPESIDALLEEESKRTQETRSQADLSSPIKPTFRRTKSENTNPTIHFSSPRAPLIITPKPQQPTKSEPKETRTRTEASETVLRVREPWQVHKAVLKEKFPEGWKPMKRLSPDALAGIRALHAQMPEQYTTATLAAHFQMDPEAIRRILKGKWTPTPEEEEDRQRRWFQRGQNVWTRYAELGVKPPAKWRDLGIGRGKPEWLKKKQATATAHNTTKSPGGREEESHSDNLADRIL